MNLKSIVTAVHAFLTPAPSVDSIVADLDKTLSKLNDAEQKLLDKAAESDTQAAELIQKSVTHRVAAFRARRVATRIGELLQ